LDPRLSQIPIALNSKEDTMVKFKWLVLLFLLLIAVQPSFADDRADKIKTLLLRPTGWKVDWSGPSGSGEAEFIYEARGEKVVAKIQDLSRSDGSSLRSCERDVTITSDGIKHDGCRDLGITLLFDPKDQDYPFKGKSPRGYEYKLKAK
jgi:hypothetical protein